MAVSVAVTLWLLLCFTTHTVLTQTVGGDLARADIRLVGGTSETEGQVLLRWSREANWTAVCHDPSFPEAVPYLMCRRLGHPFVCGRGPAGGAAGEPVAGPGTGGGGAEDPPRLAGVMSGLAFRAECSAESRAVGRCVLTAEPGLRSPCQREGEMWLSCGTVGMPSFELRRVGVTYRDPTGLLQGRCGPGFEWGALCGNGFFEPKQGRVVCRQLGLSDRAISLRHKDTSEARAIHDTNYTLFTDVGCYGNESSLTECQHYQLGECYNYIGVECFTELEDYRPTAYLCGSKQLCTDQCQQLHPLDESEDQFHYCQCDDACRLFDDCCQDYADVCRPNDERPLLLRRGEFDTDDFECLWPPGSEREHVGYLAVTRCPRHWADAGTRQLCEQRPDRDDVLGSLPVHDELGVDFKNVFCALCHGRALQALTRWNVSADDDGMLAWPDVVPPDTQWLITPPTGHRVLRTCPAHLVETCSPEYRGSRLEAACRGYYAPIKLEYQTRRYRNPHCALCNGETVQPLSSCWSVFCSSSCDPSLWGPCHGVCSPLDGFLTIEILFDFTSTGDPTVAGGGSTCGGRPGVIYDPFLRKCRALTCATGYRLDGDRCVEAPSTPTPPITDSSGDPALDACLSSLLADSGLGRPEDFAGVITSALDRETNAAAAFVRVPSAPPAGEAERAFDDAIRTLAGNPNASSLPCNASELTILVAFPYNGSATCNDFKIDGSSVYAGSSQQFLKAVAYRRHATAGEPLHTKEKAPSLCLNVTALNCSSLLTLEKDEYSLSLEGALQLNGTDQRLSFEDHVIFPDRTAVVCSYIPPEERSLEKEVRRVVSFIGSLVSLVAFAATLVTYSVFRELRNIAGIATMNLVGALFTAILMFLLAGPFSGSPGGCVFAAVLAHYAWLAAFIWMALLSFNVAKTVASMVPARGRSVGLSRAMVTFLCLGWGVPLLVVSVCLALHFCDCVGSAAALYAENGVCWITDVTARVVAFLVPMATSLVLSLGFFVFAVVSLRRTRQNTRHARNQGKAEATKEELFVYAKLSTVVGVTWVFGFVSQSVTGVVAFSYVYILLNYLQGVFVFLSFCLNKRVRAMWREKMREPTTSASRTKTTSGAKQETATLTGRSGESTTETKI